MMKLLYVAVFVVSAALPAAIVRFATCGYGHDHPVLSQPFPERPEEARAAQKQQLDRWIGPAIDRYLQEVAP